LAFVSRPSPALADGQKITGVAALPPPSAPPILIPVDIGLCLKLSSA
jgi:hypothetical protein